MAKLVLEECKRLFKSTLQVEASDAASTASGKDSGPASAISVDSCATSTVPDDESEAELIAEIPSTASSSHDLKDHKGKCSKLKQMKILVAQKELIAERLRRLTRVKQLASEIITAHYIYCLM